MTRKKPSHQKNAYAKKPAWMEFERSRAEQRRLRNTEANAAEVRRKREQEEAIFEDGCEEVTLKSVLDLPSTGQEFVYGSSHGIPGRGLKKTQRA